jgi:predicted GIY-YIG superfamily endonuclease/ribonuclease HI
MKDIALFTDVSVNPRLRLGVGAYLAMPASFLEVSPYEIDKSEVSDRIKVRRFEDTSSTKLELLTVLWALQEQQRASKGKICVYSDSQCVLSLLNRRAGLLAKDFLSRRTNRPLKNAPLYRAFCELHDALDFEVIKVEGHTRARSSDTVDRIFSFVDKRARKALRMWMDEVAAAEASAGKVCDEKWCVYVLRCRNNSLYTGMTNNIEKRLKEHESGRGSKFVRSWKPFELVKTIPCKNAGEARRLEFDLKKMSRTEKIDALALLIEPLI